MYKRQAPSGTTITATARQIFVSGTQNGAAALNVGTLTSSGQVNGVKGVFTQTGGDFPLTTSTPYDYVAKFESTDAAAFSRDGDQPHCCPQDNHAHAPIAGQHHQWRRPKELL